MAIGQTVDLVLIRLVTWRLVPPRGPRNEEETVMRDLRLASVPVAEIVGAVGRSKRTVRDQLGAMGLMEPGLLAEARALHAQLDDLKIQELYNQSLTLAEIAAAVGRTTSHVRSRLTIMGSGRARASAGSGRGGRGRGGRGGPKSGRFTARASAARSRGKDRSPSGQCDSDGDSNDNWAQCDACNKWRRVEKPAGGEGRWVCSDGTDERHNFCAAPEANDELPEDVYHVERLLQERTNGGGRTEFLVSSS